MVPVWFTGIQLATTDVKRSHKVKVTKKDVYLRDDNLADDQENITEPKRERKQNWTGLKLLVKKDLLISFMKVLWKRKCSSARIIQAIKKVTEVSDFHSSEDSSDE